MDVSQLPPLRQVLDQHEVTATKKFGQNFLFDQNITDKIARLAEITAQDTLIEIGPGPGGLTRSILKQQPKQCIVIELDNRMIPILQELACFYPNLTINHQDALAIDYTQYNIFKNLKIIANLPYNISTVLLLKWAQIAPQFQTLILMFQKEVAERLRARPNSKAYGRLTVMTNWCFDVKKCFDVDPHCFVPKPKIVSTVLRLTPRTDFAKTQHLWPFMEYICKTAFQQRRKMLKKTLQPIFDEATLISLNINPSLRPEALTIEEYVTLAQHLFMNHYEQKN